MLQRSRLRPFAIAFLALGSFWMVSCAEILPAIVATLPEGSTDWPGQGAPPLPSAPEDRKVEVHWRHPNASAVQSFRIYWGFERGQYLTAETVRLAPQPDGTFLAELTVPTGRTLHVAVSAVGPGGESPRSNRGVCEPGCPRVRPLVASPAR